MATPARHKRRVGSLASPGPPAKAAGSREPRESTIEILRSVRDGHSKHHLWDTAVFAADKVAALTKDPRDHLAHADLHIVTNRHGIAQRIITDHNLATLFPRARYLLARCYEQGHNRIAALAELDAIVAMGDAAAGDAGGLRLVALAQTLRGTLLFLQNQQTAAKASLLAALDADGRCVDAFQLLLQYALLEPREAAELCTTLSSSSRVPPLLQSLYAYRLTGSPEALEALESDGLGANADVRLAEAQKCLLGCRFRAALAITGELVANGRADEAVLVAHVASLVELGARNELYLLAQQQIQQAPQAIASWYAVACYCLLLRQAENAKMYFSKTTQMSSIFVPGLMGLGHVFMLRSEYEAAFRCYTTAAKQMPGSHQPLLCLALCERNMAAQGTPTPQEELYLELALDRAPAAPMADPDLLNEMGVARYRAATFSGEDGAEEITREAAVALLDEAAGFFRQAIAAVERAAGEGTFSGPGEKGQPSGPQGRERPAAAEPAARLARHCRGADARDARLRLHNRLLTRQCDYLYSNLGFALLHRFVATNSPADRDAAAAQFRRAVALNPQAAADAHAGLGFLAQLARDPGWYAVAIEEYVKAQAADPTNPVVASLLELLQEDLPDVLAVEQVDRVLSSAVPVAPPRPHKRPPLGPATQQPDEASEALALPVTRSAKRARVSLAPTALPVVAAPTTAAKRPMAFLDRMLQASAATSNRTGQSSPNTSLMFDSALLAAHPPSEREYSLTSDGSSSFAVTPGLGGAALGRSVASGYGHPDGSFDHDSSAVSSAASVLFTPITRRSGLTGAVGVGTLLPGSAVSGGPPLATTARRRSIRTPSVTSRADSSAVSTASRPSSRGSAATPAAHTSTPLQGRRSPRFVAPEPPSSSVTRRLRQRQNFGL